MAIQNTGSPAGIARADATGPRYKLVSMEDLAVWEHHFRQTDTVHTASLRDNITAMGMLHPLVVDSQMRVIAGVHRFWALDEMKETENGEFLRQFPDGLVPVTMLPFNADEKTDKAFEVMASENMIRKDPTPEDIMKAREFLESQNYATGPGRPKKGMKAASAVMATLLGCTPRAIKKGLHVAKLASAPATRAAAVTGEEDESPEESGKKGEASDESGEEDDAPHVVDDDDNPDVGHDVQRTADEVTVKKSDGPVQIVIAAVESFSSAEQLEFDNWYSKYRRRMS
jgi:hypothetical protein